MIPVYVVLALSVAAALVYLSSALRPEKNPPGPKGSWIVGNASQVPRIEPWRTYREWSREFGPLVYFRIFSKRFIVINNAEVAMSLLEKRSANYSDRPISRMLGELCGRALAIFSISSLHPRHMIYRRMLNTALNAQAVQSRWQFFQKQARIMLNGLSESPEKFEWHFRRYVGAGIMMIAFGYEIKSLDDQFIAMAEETSKISSQALAPGRWLVEPFPFLRFIPEWFPGAGFKRQAKMWRGRFEYLQSTPHAWVKEQIASGKYERSLTSSYLVREDRMPVTADEENITMWAAQSLYSGGADTIVSGLMSFMSLMALNEDVQVKAQNELDEVFGDASLPDLSDLDKLPYLSAVFKEVIRFAPIGPMALPHSVIEDDEYKGYHIRKGTIVLPNVWAMLHDEAEYPNPERFDPSRFLPRKEGDNGNAQPDPRKYAFGFGGRRCPGLLYAEKTMLLAMAGILSHFDIKKTGDKVNELSYTTGVTSHIVPIGFDIIPRKTGKERE